MNIGIILAAGASERFHSKVHKQYLKLNGKEVIYYSISEMKAVAKLDKIIAVVDNHEFLDSYISNKYGITCISGGDTRNKSIKLALDFVKKNYNANKILFHDCVRPFIKAELFSQFLELLDKYKAIAMTTAITDSLVSIEGDFVNRKQFNLIQTPEAFKFEELYKDFDESNENTAIISHIKDKRSCFFLKNNAFNFKISYPEDLFLAEQLMRIDYFRTTGVTGTHNQKLGKVLLLGGSGGVGSALIQKFQELDIEYYAPTRQELNLSEIKVEDFNDRMKFSPDVIINVAAAYANDEDGLLETYDRIFNVNLKANLFLIEYAKTLKKRVNIVVMSSSSSTKGRENLTNYSAAKAALNSIVESQGYELYKKNIYINAIIPEKINTPMIGKLHKIEIDQRELLDVSEVVDLVLINAYTNNYGKLIHIRKGL